MERYLFETWGYLAVFGLSFISAMGIPVGSELALIYGGVLAEGQDFLVRWYPLNSAGVILVGIAGEMLGALAWLRHRDVRGSAAGRQGGVRAPDPETRTSTNVPKHGSPNGVSRSRCWGGSSPSCGHGSRSRADSAKWRSGSSSRSRSSGSPSGPPPLSPWATASAAVTSTCSTPSAVPDTCWERCSSWRS